jgi:formate dehydrogenase subunit delta
MSDETRHRLIYMANQIGRNLAVQGHDAAVAATLDHIVKFWDPRMKAQIVALAAEGAGHFEPIAAAAVAQLRGMPARG